MYVIPRGLWPHRGDFPKVKGLSSQIVAIGPHLEGKGSGVLVGEDTYLFHKSLSLRLRNDFEGHRVDIIWELVRNAERAVSTPGERKQCWYLNKTLGVLHNSIDIQTSARVTSSNGELTLYRIAHSIVPSWVTSIGEKLFFVLKLTLLKF